jgi:hypothetical protein
MLEINFAPDRDRTYAQFMQGLERGLSPLAH